MLAIVIEDLYTLYKTLIKRILKSALLTYSKTSTLERRL